MEHSATASAHTPFPWHFHSPSAGIWTADGTKQIALVGGSRGWIKNAQDLAEQRANGLVLAASPELLRELQRAVRFLLAIPADTIAAAETELKLPLRPGSMLSAIAAAEGRSRSTFDLFAMEEEYRSRGQAASRS